MEAELRSFFPVAVSLVLLNTLSTAASAQTPEFPVPLAVVVDADGKAMVQVVSLGDNNLPKVLFNFDGVPAAFELDVENGQFEHVNNTKRICFTESSCYGDMYIDPPYHAENLEKLTQTSFVIAGPDDSTGTYRVYRSTSPDEVGVWISSCWVDGDSLGWCMNSIAPTEVSMAPAEEILPNPLEGFHGPTLANRDRLLTIQGGTKLP
jgi:hypothetical protein